MDSKLTIREFGLWVLAFCVAWASPGWIGERGIWISFYGMLVFATWRLSKFITIGWAVTFSLTIAILVAVVTIWIVNS